MRIIATQWGLTVLVFGFFFALCVGLTVGEWIQSSMDLATDLTK